MEQVVVMCQLMCTQPTDSYAGKISPSACAGCGLGVHCSHLRLKILSCNKSKELEAKEVETQSDPAVSTEKR